MTSEEQARRAESKTLDLLKDDGYFPHELREDIASRLGWHPSDVHFVIYDRFDKMVFYRTGSGMLEKARLPKQAQ